MIMSFVCLQVCGVFVCMYVMITKNKKQNKQICAVHLCFFSCMNALLHIHVCAGVK